MTTDPARRPPAVAQSVERALSLLRHFDRLHARWRVSDLARESGLPQSTVSRLLAGLEQLGFIDRVESTGQYQLGLSLVTLGSDALSNNAVFREGMGEIFALSAELRLDANLAILHGDRLFYLVTLEAPTQRTAVPLSGYVDFVHSTALGAAILSGMPDALAEETARRLPYPPVTPSTVRSPEAFLEKIRAVRARGYALDVGENSPGFVCIAAPIFDGHGMAVAACSITGPASVMSIDSRQDELAGRVREAAGLISRNLGYREVSAAHRWQTDQRSR